MRPFLTVPCVGLQSAIVVFPDHTHLLYDYEHERLFLLLRLSRAFFAVVLLLCIYMDMLKMYLFAFRSLIVLGGEST